MRNFHGNLCFKLNHKLLHDFHVWKYNENMTTHRRPGVLVFGSTATGKSAKALDIARMNGGTVINADSRQIYKGLPILTACPSATEKTLAPHVLYEVLDPGDIGSVGRWLALAGSEIARADFPVVVGGTGLYVKALLEGLPDIPDVPPVTAGYEEMFLTLIDKEPEFTYEDPQRVARSYAVLKRTGKPLSWWQKQPARRIGDDVEWRVELVDMPPEDLNPRINARIDRMLQEGAMEEVRAFLDLGLPDTLPAMRTIGVPELARHIRGEISLESAAELMRIATRQYAKQQRTWLKGQFG